MSLRLRAARFSILVSLAVLAIKYAAYAVTGSGALLSDAIETILNVIAASGTLWAVAFSLRPADDNHPYGHGKAEYVWAVIEGTLVVLTALVILGISAYDAFHLEPLTAPFLGVALNATAGVVNFFWARFLMHVGRKNASQALIVSGEHVLTDVWASVALVLGVGLIPFTGWTWLDPFLSALVALNVLWTGFGMVRRSVSGLLDEAPSPTETSAVWTVIAANGAGALEAHDLRMRKVGTLTYVDFHLVVPDEMHVFDAHVICDRIETAIRQQIGRASISIHLEPQHMAKYPPDSRAAHHSQRSERHENGRNRLGPRKVLVLSA